MASSFSHQLSQHCSQCELLPRLQWRWQIPVALNSGTTCCQAKITLMPHKSSRLSQGALPLSACLPPAAASPDTHPLAPGLEGAICQLGVLLGKGQKGCAFSQCPDPFLKGGFRNKLPRLGWFQHQFKHRMTEQRYQVSSGLPNKREQTEGNNEYILTSATLGNFITITHVCSCISRCAAAQMFPVANETGSAPKSIDFQL